MTNDPNSTKISTTKNTRKSLSIWPFLIVGLLALHISGMVYAVVLCTRHKPAVVDNYYQKAVQWDKKHEGAGF